MAVDYSKVAIQKISQLADTLQKVNPVRWLAEEATKPITRSLKVGDYGATQMSKSTNAYENTFGNFYTKQKQATSAGLNTFGRGVSEFGQSSWNYLKQTPYSSPEQNAQNLAKVAPSVARTLMGAGQTVASVNPLVMVLRGGSSTPFSQKLNVNVPFLGQMNVPDTLTSMVEFTKDPAWKAIFPVTSKFLNVTNPKSVTGKVANFLVGRIAKGSTEGLIQGWSTLPENATGDEKVNHFLMNVGFGALSEVTIDAFAKSINYAGDKTKLKNIIINLSDRLSQDVSKSKQYFTEPFYRGPAETKYKTRFQTDIEQGKFKLKNRKGSFNPEELDKTVKELQQEPTQPKGVPEGGMTGKQVESEMIKIFGSANKPEDVSFITNDGRTISGKGVRMHIRQILGVQKGFDPVKSPIGSEVSYMDKAQNLRTVVKKDSVNVDTVHLPTEQQFKILEKISKGKPIYADITTPNYRSPTGNKEVLSGRFENFNDYKKWVISNSPQPEGGVGVKGVQPETPQLKQTISEPISPLKTQPVKTQLRTEPKDLIQEANLKQSTVPEAKPLESIITQGTDVKAKVGLLDYLRTPDRVLKKMGLENESMAIRKAYDTYLTQLPKEINKVTEWSKQVSPESNQRIFQFLDGQKVELNPNEAKVAGEVRSYLDDWAKKLKLPDDKRISHYITHIFEKDFIKKEFDEDLAKLIQNRVAGSVYDPFLEKRLGKMGYVEDTWRSLDAYVKRATRKYNMDPALEMTKEAAKKLEISQFNYVKNYVDRINLRPSEIDNLVDNQIKQVVGYKFGQRPTSVITRAGRQAVYRGTLGLNPGTAIKNLTQGANTYAKLGEKYTLKGYLDIFTKGSKELEAVGVLKNDFIEDRILSSGKQTLQKIDKGLFYFFETAEKINRGAAYYGAKAKALASGLDEAAAIEAGKKTVRDTQFTFGSVDTPVAMQSDIVKLLTQFQSYTLKQTEFLGEMITAKDVAGLLRYGLASTVMVATLGKLIGMKPTDIIPSFRVGLPPTLQTPVEIGKALLNAPDKYGNEQTTEEKLQNVGKSLIPFVPAGSQIRKTVTGLGDVIRGYSKSQSGRVRYPVAQTLTNTARGALFGANNLPEARQYYDTKATPLSETQSELFKQSTDRTGTYQKIINTRASNKELTKIKDEVSKNGESKTFDGKIIYQKEDGEIGTINIGKVASMPETSSYEKLQKQKAAYALTDYIINLPIDQQSEAFAKLGISPDDATYYQVAKGTNDLKRAFINDDIKNLDTKDRGNLIKYLVSQRKEINGDMVLANGIIDDLYEEGIISSSEKTMLKNLKIVDGKPVTKLSGRGKKTTLKKVSLPTSTEFKAPKIKDMGQLLSKNVKLKIKKYKFRRTL